MTSEPSYPTRIEKNVRIPMRDGVRLAADLYRPDTDGAWPDLIEYIPYRKDDMTAPRHGPHVYFAERGYVGVRLDVRGTGASEGQLPCRRCSIKGCASHRAAVRLSAIGSYRTPHASTPISASALSSQKPMAISLYIAAAVVRCSRACSPLPVRR